VELWSQASGLGWDQNLIFDVKMPINREELLYQLKEAYFTEKVRLVVAEFQ